jgi:hypothetical protein
MEVSFVTTMSDDEPPLESMKRRLFEEAYEPSDTKATLYDHTFLLHDEHTQAMVDDDPGVTSPTSVAVVFGGVFPDLTSKSIILMGDEGAEVALQDATTGVGTVPDRNLFSYPSSNDSYADARTSSLLDVERTPRKSPMRNPGTTDLFVCGGNEMLLGCDGGGHAFIERTIQSFLEDSAASPDSFHACTDWQAWSYFGFGGPSKESPVETSPSKENIRSVLRSRASQSLGARKSAVRQLRKDLAPFADSPARAPELFRNRSFSVSDHRSAIVRVSKDKESKRNSFTDVLHLCTMPENTTLETPDLVRRNPSGLFHDEDLSYDSDPEDFARRRPMMDNEDISTSDCIQHRGYSAPSFSPSRAIFDVHNDEVFSTIVQEIFNQSTTLVQHPFSDSCNPGGLVQRPIAVEAWLERGQHLTYALIQPKWMWKAKPRETKGLKNFQKVNLQGIELLDITRILRMEDIEGGSQAFARPSHCVVIKSIHNEEFCFEAKSVQERNRLVYSLKIVIARFGAKVLVGDPDVYWEFFSMMEGAPGAPPRLQRAYV